MERPPFGPPLGAATQSTGRPMAENNRGLASTTMRRVANPPMRPAPPNAGLMPLPQVRTEAQVTALAREAMRIAVEENRTRALATQGVSNELRPGITIDLSHKQIREFPEEVVDIIKNELERLALSHNLLYTFPARFSECTSLRYLNVRNNSMREIPQAICELYSLEILDLGRNKLQTLPPELVKLTSLKVLSVQRNRIKELPLCIMDMTSLQVLKLDGNPLQFPPREILQPQASSPSQESEFDDIVVTAQIKTFLRQSKMKGFETESGEEESSEGTAETPRPTRRVMSGRFPIKVNGTDVSSSLRSPALPQVPMRSHLRASSQQNAARPRPGVMPLTIPNVGGNERGRSNSETTLQPTRELRERERERPADRSRRMGIVSRKASELGTVEESRDNRHSHYRGLSHGSAMQGTSTSSGVYGIISSSNSRSPASPADSATSRATYVRRLSSLPERKRESRSPDPVIEGAKGVLFALFQVHPLIQSLLGLARDGTNKRTSLERVFYNATTHVEELDRDIQEYDTYSEEDEDPGTRSNGNVHSACLTCVNAYVHVCGLLDRNVESLISNGDPRYIRTLLLQLYGALAEIRNAGVSLLPQARESRASKSSGSSRAPRDKSITPTRERPGPGVRTRSATVVQHPNNLRVATNVPKLLKATGRSATMSSATPRSGDSFASSTASSGRAMAGGDFTEEDRIFEDIFLRLIRSTDMAITTLPSVHRHFVDVMRASNQQQNSDLPNQYWQLLILKCNTALQTADTLKGRLSTIKLKEPGIRTQGTFWELCNAFIDAYTALVMHVKDAKALTTLLPTDVIILLRPLQKAIKETGQLIQTSPWAFLAGRQPVSSGMNNLQSPAVQVQLPMTPQSAALGPAVQATVPSTPQSASFGSIFSGNVFERADTLLSMNSSSSSVLSSRTATMNSSTHTAESSMSSILSPMIPSMGYRGGYPNGKATYPSN